VREVPADPRRVPHDLAYSLIARAVARRSASEPSEQAGGTSETAAAANPQRSLNAKWSSTVHSGRRDQADRRPPSEAIAVLAPRRRPHVPVDVDAHPVPAGGLAALRAGGHRPSERCGAQRAHRPTEHASSRQSVLAEHISPLLFARSGLMPGSRSPAGVHAVAEADRTRDQNGRPTTHTHRHPPPNGIRPTLPAGRRAILPAAPLHTAPTFPNSQRHLGCWHVGASCLRPARRIRGFNDPGRSP
jgi:hypothetical protein